MRASCNNQSSFHASLGVEKAHACVTIPEGQDVDLVLTL